MKLTRGFTLVEILVYVSILAITAGLLTAVLTNTVRVRTRAANSTELAQQLNFVLGTVQSLVNESANVEGVYEGADSGVACSEFCTLNLRMTATSTDPTLVSSDVNGIYLKQGSNATTTLTGAGVTVDHFELTKFEFEGGHATVRVDMALTIDSANPQFAVTRSIQSAIGRVTAAVFDDHLLPNAANTYDVGQTSSEWRNAAFAGNVTIAGALDLTSITSGFLPPRVTTVQRDAISSPGAGSLVYNTTTSKYNFYDSTAWGILGGLWNASSTAIYYNDGFVGIGTDNPTYNLDVAGSGRFTSPVVVATPVGASDAATKAYVDAAGGTDPSTCYIESSSSNIACATGYTAMITSTGTGCQTTSDSTGIFVGPFTYGFRIISSGSSFYQEVLQYRLPMTGTWMATGYSTTCSYNYGATPIASTVQLCCK